MKKIVVFTLILCCFCSAYSQDFREEYNRQVIKIDSLEKVIKEKEKQFDEYDSKNKKNLAVLSDSIKKLKSFEKFRKEKKTYDDQLKQKDESIALLNRQISEKDGQISEERKKSEQKAREEKENGKNEILANIENSYKGQLDDLLKSSTKQSVQRDMKLVGNNPEVKAVLSDLEKYFNAQELLSKKFDAAQIKTAEAQLNQIDRKSALLDELMEILENYQTFNNGLKETVEKLIENDRQFSVAGMGSDIQKQKLTKILSEISSYIFDYDFNFTDYPYLSDVVLEIIKRKQPEPDADIGDLLRKL